MIDINCSSNTIHYTRFTFLTITNQARDGTSKEKYRKTHMHQNTLHVLIHERVQTEVNGVKRYVYLFCLAQPDIQCYFIYAMSYTLYKYSPLLRPTK